MELTIEERDGNLVAVFDGRLDTLAASEIEQEIHKLDDCEGHNIMLDCTAMDYISSSGLRLFLSILKNAKAKGSRVIITGCNDSLHQIFTMTGFIKLFEFK